MSRKVEISPALGRWRITDKFPQSRIIKFAPLPPMVYSLKTNSANPSRMNVNVNPNRDLQAAANVPRPGKGIRPTPVKSDADFTASAKLTEKLAATSEVRSAAVDRAKALINDPNYPSPVVVDKIAAKLASHIHSSNPAPGSSN